MAGLPGGCRKQREDRNYTLQTCVDSLENIVFSYDAPARTPMSVVSGASGKWRGRCVVWLCAKQTLTGQQYSRTALALGHRRALFARRQCPHGIHSIGILQTFPGWPLFPQGVFYESSSVQFACHFGSCRVAFRLSRPAVARWRGRGGWRRRYGNSQFCSGRGYAPGGHFRGQLSRYRNGSAANFFWRNQHHFDAK